MRAVFAILIFFGIFFNVFAEFNYENSLDRAVATGLQELYLSGELVRLYARYINLTEEQAATFINYTCPPTTFANRTNGNDIDLFLRRGILDIVVDTDYPPYESYDNETGEVSGIFISAWRQIARSISDYYNTTLRVRFHPLVFDPYEFFSGIVTGAWYSEAAIYWGGNQSFIDQVWQFYGIPEFIGLITVSCTFDASPIVVAWNTSAYSSFEELRAANVTLAFSFGTFVSNQTVVQLPGFNYIEFATTEESFAAVQSGEAQAILESYVNLIVVPGFSLSEYSVERVATMDSGIVLKIRSDDIAPPPSM